MVRFLVVPQWQGSPAPRAMLLVDGASAIALDSTGRQLVIGTSDGSLWTYDVSALDTARDMASIL